MPLIGIALNLLIALGSIVIFDTIDSSSRRTWYVFPSVYVIFDFVNQLIAPAVRGLPQVRESLLSFSSPPVPHHGCRSCPVHCSLLFFFLSSCLDTWASSCSFRCLRSSAGVQQVLRENCSLCSCTLGVLVGRGEHHILLCHPESSQEFFP